MNRFFSFATINFLFSIILLSCSSNEPSEEYIKKQFAQNHKHEKFIKAKNTEVSPPCFYWDITFKDSLNNIKTEKWQFWEVDSTDNNWPLVIL